MGSAAGNRSEPGLPEALTSCVLWSLPWNRLHPIHHCGILWDPGPSSWGPGCQRGRGTAAGSSAGLLSVAAAGQAGEEAPAVLLIQFV